MSSNSIADQLKKLGYPQAHFASKDGQMGIIPTDQVEQAKAAGYEVNEPAVYMTSPDGKLGLVPRSQAKSALDKGYQVGQPTQENYAPAKVNYVPNQHDRELLSDPRNVIANTAPIQPPNIPVEPVGTLTGQTSSTPYQQRGSVPIKPLPDMGLPGSFEGHPENVGETMNDTSLLAGPGIVAREAMDRSAEDSPGWVKNYITPAGKAGMDQLEGLSKPSVMATLGAMKFLGAGSPLARTLQRAASGYFGTQMAKGVTEGAAQFGEALGRGDVPGAVQSGLNTGASAAMLGDTVHGAIKSAPGTLRDAKDVAESLPGEAVAGRDALATKLRNSAVEQYRQVLNPTTRQNKNITDRIVPELLDRGVIASSPDRLVKRAQSNLQAAGQRISDIWENLPEETKIEAQPLLSKLEEYRQNFQNRIPISEQEAAKLGSKKDSDVAVEVVKNDDGTQSFVKVVPILPDAINAINSLQEMVINHGSEIPAPALRKMRQVLDDVVARHGGYAGTDLADGSKVDAMRELAGVAREELGKIHPDMRDANAEYNFWKNVERVSEATRLRRIGQQGGLKNLAYQGAGAIVGEGIGGPLGALAGKEIGKGLAKAERSTLLNTTSAVLKNKLARAISSKNRMALESGNPPELPPSPETPETPVGNPPSGSTPPSAPPFLRGKVSHPDVPNGNVVGIDADTNLPIIKREASSEATAPQATEAKSEPVSSPASVPAESVESKMERANNIAREQGSTLEDGSFGPASKSSVPKFMFAGKTRMPEPGRVGEAKVSDLSVAPGVMQYKLDTDASGVTQVLKDSSKFNPELAGTISVYTAKPNDAQYGLEPGKTYVVNGHHRYELAQRTGYEGNLPVRHIMADDAMKARATGALQNIAEGRGTPVDAAKFMRDSSVTVDELKARGISLGDATAQKAVALARLDDGLFNQVVQKELPVERAVAIGEASDNPAEQKAIADLIAAKERKGQRVTNDTLRELVRMVQSSGQKTETTSSLFGEEQVTRSLALEKAEVSAYIKEQMSKDRRFFSTISKTDNVARLEASEVGKVDAEKGKALSTSSAQAAEVYEKLSTRSGPIADILNQAAERLSNGESAVSVKQEAYRGIRAEIAKTLGGGEGPDAGPGGGVPEKRGTSSSSEASDEQGPVTPEGAGDLFRSEDVTNSPEFKKWFGGSKVVDENGKPLVVYHGTNVDFSAFDKSKIKSRFQYSFGLHFTSRPQEASRYAEGDGGNVRPVYLKAEHPLVIDTENPAPSMEADLNKADIIHKLSEAKKNGTPYDSVIIRRIRGDEWDSFNAIVFDPKQVKSAIGNRGTFDPNNDNILFRGGDGDKGDPRDILANAREIDFRYHQAQGRIPSYIEVSEPAAKIFRHILGSSKGAVGANIEEIRGTQLAGRLSEMAKASEQYDPTASRKLSQLSEAVKKATEEYDGHNFVVKTADSAEMKMRTQEELFHSAVQRRVGPDNIADAIPESMYDHPVIRKMVPDLENLKPAEKAVQAAEAIHDLYSGEASEKISDEEVASALTHYFESLEKMGQGERVLDAQAIKDFIDEKFGDRIPASRKVNDEPAREALRRVAGRIQSTVQEERVQDRRRLSGGEERPNEKGSASGSGEGDEGDLSRPQGQGVDDLHYWVRQARSIEVSHVGEQYSLVPGESAESVFQLKRTDANGDIEKQLVTAPELRKLREFAPFQQAEAASKQQGMFSSNDGEIIGSGARGGVELPPQSDDSQGSLFRTKIPVLKAAARSKSRPLPRFLRSSR